MARTTIPNEFMKYWHPEKKEWHQNIVGIYHVSTIGTSHQDLDPSDHSGPCLRNTYWNYTDPKEESVGTIGNLETGTEHHERLQVIIKQWKPTCMIEDPLAVVLVRFNQKTGKPEMILLVGSVDILYTHQFNLDEMMLEAIELSKENDSLESDYFNKKEYSIWDIKTASDYTLPRGPYDKNPTHLDQTTIYGHIKLTFFLNPQLSSIKRIKIIYIDKHNKGTYVQKEAYKPEEAEEKFNDCVERCWYIHDCLLSKKLPVPEPMHWCKYCNNLERCLEQGDVEPILKRGKIDNLKVV